jgi:hypothetical protein
VDRRSGHQSGPPTRANTPAVLTPSADWNCRRGCGHYRTQTPPAFTRWRPRWVSSGHAGAGS